MKSARAGASGARRRAERNPAVAPDTDLHLHESESIGALVREAYVGVRNRFHDQLRIHRITSAQWVFLRILWDFEGLNQKELSEKVHLHPTTAVSALRVLERNGYIRRKRSATDRRVVHVFLTEAGRQLQPELIPFARLINDRLLRGFSHGEQGACKEFLRRMIKNLNEE